MRSSDDVDQVDEELDAACRICGCTYLRACALVDDAGEVISTCWWVADPDGAGPLCSVCFIELPAACEKAV